MLPHVNEGYSICLEQSRRFYSVRETLCFLNTIWSEVLGSKDQIEQLACQLRWIVSRTSSKFNTVAKHLSVQGKVVEIVNLFRRSLVWYLIFNIAHLNAM